MKTSIQVENRKQGDAIRAGLDDPETRAFIIIMGALTELPSDRARARLFTYVQDFLDERDTSATTKVIAP